MAELPIPAPYGPQIAPQADNDVEVVSLWLHSKAPQTRLQYAREIDRFLTCVGVPIQQARLADVHRFLDALEESEPAPATRARVTATIKSLLSFCHSIGYTTFNVGRAVTIRRALEGRAQRIITEEATLRIIAIEPDPVRKTLIRLMYACGLRVSETHIRWRDLQPRANGGQVTVLGKGGKTRALLLSQATWDAVQALKPQGATPDQYVFLSRKGNPISTTQVWRIVKQAAERAGVLNVSPHWLRHAHATHALDRHCPLHVLQASLAHQSLSTTSVYVHARPDDGSGLYLAV